MQEAVHDGVLVFDIEVEGNGDKPELSKEATMFKCLIILAVCASLSAPVCAAKKSDSITYRIKWQEQAGRILHRSVCYNYEDGSIPYRRCRVQAQKHFVQQCRYFTAKYEKTKAPYNQEFRSKRDKFCYSADRYYPF